MATSSSSTPWTEPTRSYGPEDTSGVVADLGVPERLDGGRDPLDALALLVVRARDLRRPAPDGRARLVGLPGGPSGSMDTLTAGPVLCTGMETDVLIVGGGVAGLTAGTFTSRAGLETLIVDGDESILRRNALLENYPGFPAGVDSRLFLDMARAQAERAGCSFAEGTVSQITHAAEEGTEGTDDEGGFEVATEDGEVHRTGRVIAASWSDSSYLESLDVELDRRGSKQFIETDRDGHTAVEGIYAAGRIAKQYHQTVISAGHGAQVALTLIHDSDLQFYNDWVAPEGYFSERGRDVPPGCEEISDEERERRAAESRETMREWFAEPYDDDPTPHPSLADE